MNLQLLRKLLLVGVVWAYSITKGYSSGMFKSFCHYSTSLCVFDDNFVCFIHRSS